MGEYIFCKLVVCLIMCVNYFWIVVVFDDGRFGKVVVLVKLVGYVVEDLVLINLIGIYEVKGGVLCDDVGLLFGYVVGD